MRKLVLSLMAMLSVNGCSQMKNPNHCNFTDGFCANSDAGPSCNIASGQCEPIPLVIDNISPAIPGPTDRTILIKGNGFYNITSLLANGMDILRSVSIKSTTDIEVDLQTLLSASGGSPFLSTRCGPVPVKIDRKDGASVTAEEKTGRGFSRWKYEMPYAAAIQPSSDVVDFAFAAFDKTQFDYISYSRKDNSSFIGGFSKIIPGLSNPNLIYIKKDPLGVLGSLVPAFVLHDKSTLLLDIVANGWTGRNFTSGDVCDSSQSGYSIFNLYPIFDGDVVKIVKAVCTEDNGKSFKVKKIESATNTSFLSKHAISAAITLKHVSFAPSDDPCGVAVTNEGGNVDKISAICGTLSQKGLIPTTLPGRAESVASAKSLTSQTYHYVLTSSNNALGISRYGAAPDVNSSGKIYELAIMPIELKASDVGDFSRLGAKIEVKDINCDDKMDVIIKTDRRVVAYLGISDTSWESTPKVLFEMPSTDANTTIKKSALWIPDYRSTAGVGVLGILDSNSNLSLYQQQ